MRTTVAALILGAVLVAGCSGDDDDEATPTTRVANPVAAGDVPPEQASSCSVVNASDLAAVNGALDPGLVIAVATADTDSDGVLYIVGSIYDVDSGVRISSVDTWAIIDGTLHAVSGSANDYSELPDGRDVLAGPQQGFASPVVTALGDCATRALTG